ncbi:hypothetical protein GIB67_021736 [Kingdonia uniflora]|uniref:Uncharacterized protein n=1 Tax=Kingdonia uniflora TaxID=39325 RepID=A0A7J7L2B6_9MAGN|nr:hypothetical protein GIB67_021736 [Kingdonia uniflora]
MKENPFVQTLEGYDSELCFSLDGYVGDFGSNFAYKDCPGIVCCNSIEQDISSKNTFTLPSVLSAQCANFVISRRVLERETPMTKILPSELVFLQSEVGLWNNDYPCSYSSSVVRVVLSLRVDELGDCVKWVLRNSPRYGIVIDAPMRDHIFLLFKLCLKAISLEAYHLSTSQNPTSQVFECPVLVEVMSWLACQLSGLYGELQGKLFCINMLKHCVLSVSKVKVEELDGKCERGNFICGGDGNCSGSLVFVSQVAAAVAALHERSVLEEKIKGLRLSGSLSKLQLITEHSYLTTKANDERRKRSNYRPILEHDGLLWQRPRNQDSNENKTEEELLAEERDYKRRRTSYRGKKVKRSTTEVMRDIIEEHMEEIKQAGGIGCFVKGSFESGTVLHGSVSVNTDVQIERASRDYRKEPPMSYSNMVLKREGSPVKDSIKNSHYKQMRDSYSRHEPLEDHRRSRKEKHDREYRSKSPESSRSNEGSHGRHGHRGERDELEVTRTKYEKNYSASSHRSNYRDSRSSSSLSVSSRGLRERSKDRHKGRTHGTHRSDSAKQDTFEDRYDPSRSESYQET